MSKHCCSILIGHALDQEHLDKIRSIAPQATIRCIPWQAVSSDDLAGVDIFLGRPPRELLREAHRLQWIHLPSAGVDGYVDADFYAGDILLTNSSGVFGIPLAEHVFALMLAFSRKLYRYHCSQVAKRWEKGLGSAELYGQTVGILGLGDIGREVAKRASVFGMQVWALKRKLAIPPDYVHQLVDGSGLRDLLEASDYVVITLPLTQQTRGLVGRQEIGWIRPHGVLINVGRGQVVDEAALVEALQEGAIAGAGLDVFAEEPLPPTSALWGLPNVIITPHVAGISPNVTGRIVENFCRNLKLWQAGRTDEMTNIVDPEIGY